MLKTKTRPYDTANYLTNPEIMTGYLEETFIQTNCDIKAVNIALDDIRRAMKIHNISCNTESNKVSHNRRSSDSQSNTSSLEATM